MVILEMMSNASLEFAVLRQSWIFWDSCSIVVVVGAFYWSPILIFFIKGLVFCNLWRLRCQSFIPMQFFSLRKHSSLQVVLSGMLYVFSLGGL